jgi:hypothetical protein
MRWKLTVSPLMCFPRLWDLFALEDAELQEACFRIANDWLIEYCQTVPGRLVGIPMISLYNIKNGIRELERCKKEGLVGCLIWQVPARAPAFYQRLLQSVLGSGAGYEHAGQPAHSDGIQL